MSSIAIKNQLNSFSWLGYNGKPENKLPVRTKTLSADETGIAVSKHWSLQVKQCLILKAFLSSIDIFEGFPLSDWYFFSGNINVSPGLQKILDKINKAERANTFVQATMTKSSGSSKMRFQKANWLPNLMGSRKHLSSSKNDVTAEDDFDYDEEDFTPANVKQETKFWPVTNYPGELKYKVICNFLLATFIFHNRLRLLLLLLHKSWRIICWIITEEFSFDFVSSF